MIDLSGLHHGRQAALENASKLFFIFFSLTTLQRCGMLLAAHSVIIPQSQPDVAPGVPSRPPQWPGKVTAGLR